MYKAVLAVLMGLCAVDAFAAEQLDEVQVEGRRRITAPRGISAWFDRLVGDFIYEGFVERFPVDGDPQREDIRGVSQCVRFDRAIALQCIVNTTNGGLAPSGNRAAGGHALPASAVTVFGLNHAAREIGHLQVDDDGVARLGRGGLFDDTLVSRDKCADFPGCVRTLRLQALPDAKNIRMRVDVERDGVLRARHEIQWKRQSQPPTIAALDPSGDGLGVGSGTGDVVRVPAAIDAWLRRLPGHFDVDVISSARPADAECQGIGAGPGVRCAIYMAWPERGIPVRRSSQQRINSGFFMLGFDPVTQGIAIVDVTPGGVPGPAGFASGLLSGDTLSYTPDCGRPPCIPAVQQIVIVPGGQRARWDVFGLGVKHPPTASWQLRRLPVQDSPPDSEPLTPPRRPVVPPKGR